MSGHLRFGFAALLLVGAYAAPAASNPLTDLLTPNTAPEAASAPAQAECLLQPGQSTAAGAHWVYRYDGHRKCWFQAEASTALARKPAHRRAAPPRATAPEENESAARKQEVVADARAEMLNSAPVEATQPAAPAPTPAPTPTIKIVRAVPVTGSAAPIPPPSVPATPAADQPTPEQPRPVDVEALLADTPAASDEVASVPPATSVAAPGAGTGGDGGWTTSWLGVLLIGLGFAAVLGAALSGRFLNASRSMPSRKVARVR
jgi:hypothetical protein